MSCAAWFVCWFVCLSVQQTRKHPLCYYYYYYYYYYQLLLHVLRLLSVTESELSGFFFYAFLYNTSIFTTPCHQRSASHTAFLLFVKCFRLLVTSVFFQYLAAYICLFVSDWQCWRLLHVCVLYIILKKAKNILYLQHIIKKACDKSFQIFISADFNSGMSFGREFRWQNFSSIEPQTW